MKINCIPLCSTLLAVGLALASSLTAQVTILQDTLAPLPPLTVDDAMGLEHTIAQQFFTDHQGAISSVTIAAYRVGRPTGRFHLELWEDGGGIPGKRVATLGTQEAAEVLAFTDFEEQRWQEVTFEKAVTGLHPNSSYYLVIDMAEMVQDWSNLLYFSRLEHNPFHAVFLDPKLKSERRAGSWFSGGRSEVGMRIATSADDLPAGDPGITMLYDNFFNTEHRGRACPESSTLLAAQPFTVGRDGVVSSATIDLANYQRGYPTGVARLEIWNEVDGKPGHPVGILGEVDFSTVSGAAWTDPFFGRYSTWETRTFNNPVTGLEPGATYFVVANVSDLTIPGIPCMATVSGADESDELMVQTSWGGWVPIYVVSGRGRQQFRMTLTADPADVPRPKFSSITRSETGVKLTWKSVPFRTYTVEFSETLEEGSWREIATNLDAGGGEASHDDTEPSRMGLEQGFYRVRMEE